MNGFRKLQERLTAEGWFVGWNLPCCQSCAWGDLPWKHEEGPHKGEEIDLSKVLFNHSQDCEVDYDYEECPECQEEGCEACDYVGGIKILGDQGDFDDSVYGFICYTPEQSSGSMFCFDGDKQGVKNLKEILPIIEECGCEWSWDKTGKSRIHISWD